MDTPLIRPNRLKRLLAEGKTPIGVFLIEFRQAAVLQILANCGFDFVIIDNEHGVFSIESIADLARAARLLDLTPIVRIPDHAYPWIAQALDAGALGIMAPRIETPAQVAGVVRSMKYPPQSGRGATRRGSATWSSAPARCPRCCAGRTRRRSSSCRSRPGARWRTWRPSWPSRGSMPPWSGRTTSPSRWAFPGRRTGPRSGR